MRIELDEQVAEKGFGMLRVPQHERKDINVINAPPLSLNIGAGSEWPSFEQDFSATPSMRESNPGLLNTAWHLH